MQGTHPEGTGLPRRSYQALLLVGIVEVAKLAEGRIRSASPETHAKVDFVEVLSPHGQQGPGGHLQASGGSSHETGEDADARLVPEGPCHRAGVVTPTARLGVGPRKGGGVRRRHGQKTLGAEGPKRVLHEGGGTPERVHVHVVEAFGGEEGVQILTENPGLGESISLHVATDELAGLLPSVVEGHVQGRGDFQGEPNALDPRGGKAVQDPADTLGDRRQEENRDVPGGRHRGVVEGPTPDLPGSLPGVVFRDEDIRPALLNRNQIRDGGYRSHSPLSNPTILYGRRFRFTGVTSRMRTSSRRRMSCRRGFRDFL